MKKKAKTKEYAFPEEGNNIVNESSIVYQTSSEISEERSLPDHVLEDIRTGLEQYAKGECRSVNEYMAKYR